MGQCDERISIDRGRSEGIYSNDNNVDSGYHYEKQAKKIAAIYLLFGCIWILASDRILNMVVNDRELILNISIMKGWIYVLLTGALIYFLTRSAFGRISVTSNALAREAAERKEREAMILHLSYHDMLTGLYNRRYFEQELEKCNEGGTLPVSLVLWDVNGLKIVNDVYGYVKGDELLKLFASEIDRTCAGCGTVARWGGDEFAVLLPGMSNSEAVGFCKEIIDRLEAQNIEKPLPASISFGVTTNNTAGETVFSMLKDAEDMLFRNKLTQVDSSRYYVIESIKQSLYEKDIETEEHAERLKSLSVKLGKLLGLSKAEEKELEIFAMLHDIGKIAISDSILNKPDKLDNEEWERMKRHSEIGFRIVRSVPELANVAEYILSHHEKWDGSGYPEGLNGESIPIAARIVAVTDAYDAMTSNRPYRKAMTMEDAVRELKDCAGSHFDPEIVSIFIEKVLDDHRHKER